MNLDTAKLPLYYRFRQPILVAIYALGLWSPWVGRTGLGSGLVWLILPELLVRFLSASLESVTVSITLIVCTLLALGAFVRTWAAYYVNTSPVQSHGLQTEQPEARTRQPDQRLWSHAGAAMFAVGISVLMPPSGAGTFLLALLVFYGLLWRAERHGPLTSNGHSPSGSKVQRWFMAAIRESFFLGFALCFAAFAWRYNPQTLLRCLLICFGISLVLRAGVLREPVVNERAKA